MTEDKNDHEDNGKDQPPVDEKSSPADAAQNEQDKQMEDGTESQT